jgi:tetratricopeptide (TPR) repeat protein
LGNYAAAEPLLHEALDIQRKTLGEHHPNYAQSLNNLAVLYKDMGNYRAAKKLSLEATWILHKNVGKQHPDFATDPNKAFRSSDKAAFHAEGQLYWLEKSETADVNNADEPRWDLDGAMALYKEQEEICRELGNKDGQQKSLGNQAPILKARGDLDGAMALYKEEERICRELGNKDGLKASLGNQAGILKTKLLERRVDLVGFTITAPSIMVPNNSYIVDVWAHLKRQRAEVLRRARETERRDITSRTSFGTPIERGTTLHLRLSIPHLVVSDPEGRIVWKGEIANATFPVEVPADASVGEHAGVVTVYAAGIEVAKLHFVLHLGSDQAPIDQVPTTEKLIRSAFASYSSSGRDQVLARVQMLHKALPDLDLFLDVFSLRSGERWRERLYEEIQKRDKFYLFWSKAASESKWVEREWRCALISRGIDFIDPVPLVDPSEVLPPQELADELHFNDWHLAFMRGPTQPR